MSSMVCGNVLQHSFKSWEPAQKSAWRQVVHRQAELRPFTRQCFRQRIRRSLLRLVLGSRGSPTDRMDLAP
jgi:hypothetical protein